MRDLLRRIARLEYDEGPEDQGEIIIHVFGGPPRDPDEPREQIIKHGGKTFRIISENCDYGCCD